MKSTMENRGIGTGVSITGNASLRTSGKTDGSIPRRLTYNEGSSHNKPFKNFQIRWREKLGKKDNPYLVRWTILFYGYSIRLHHWFRSDDNRAFHDHSCDLISIVLRGRYTNVTPNGEFPVSSPSIWRAKAKDRHWLKIPKGGAWTLLLCSRPYHKWGFYVNGKKWRPLRYFHKFGIIQDNEYQ